MPNIPKIRFENLIHDRIGFDSDAKSHIARTLHYAISPVPVPFTDEINALFRFEHDRKSEIYKENVFYGPKHLGHIQLQMDVSPIRVTFIPAQYFSPKEDN